MQGCFFSCYNPIMSKRIENLDVICQISHNGTVIPLQIRTPDDKDNAQSAFHQLQDAYCSRELSDKQKAHYEPILADLAKRLESFTHKEQKAFWYVK